MDFPAQQRVVGRVFDFATKSIGVAEVEALVVAFVVAIRRQAFIGDEVVQLAFEVDFS